MKRKYIFIDEMKKKESEIIVQKREKRDKL